MDAWSVFAVARYELRRESSKKSLWIIVLLMVLPMIVAVIVRAFTEQTQRDPLLWTRIMGFSAEGLTGGVLAAVSLSLLSWSWLVAVLYGGDLFASDLGDHALNLILSRPVTREEYVAGKILAVAVSMVFIFVVAGVAVLGAAWVLGGPQDRALSAVLYSGLMGIGVLPLLLTSALLGLYTKKPVTGTILGFVGWLGGSIITGLLFVYYGFVSGDPYKAITVTYIGNALYPFTAGQDLPMIVYSRLNNVVMEMPVPTGTEEVTMISFSPGDYAVYYIAGTLGWILVLSLAVVYLLRKRDL